MRIARALALLSLIGINIVGQQPAAAGSLPYIPKGADVPKEAPAPETFVVFDSMFQPSIRNEVTSGSIRGMSMNSFGVRGASEFTLIGTQMEAEFAYKRYSYVPVSGFTALDNSLSVHMNMQVSPQKIYAGLGYINFTNNYNFPRIGGLGAGIGKLPMLDRRFSVSGSLWFYPNVYGSCGVQICTSGPLTFAYRAFDYDLGATYTLRSRLFLNAGVSGDRLGAKPGAPSDISHAAARAGLGMRL